MAAGIRSMFQAQYLSLKAVFMEEKGYDVPAQYQSAFVHWGGGAEIQYIYRRLAEGLPPRARVLIVGAMGGRDYFLFKNLGHDVVALDIGLQPDIPGIVIANVEEDLPFPDGEFDLVIISEVLEHLEFDARALRNIARVLKSEGKLIVSVPYYNDWEAGHVRIHSPISARRLLDLGGFSILDYLERPGIVPPNRLNVAQHALSLLCFKLTGRTAYPLMTSLVGRGSWYLGHRSWLRRVRRRSWQFGGFYLCAKAPSRLDHVGLNRRLYTSPDDVPSVEGPAG